jgi:class 3 adenylate cyclase
MTLHIYLPQDRLQALANNTSLADRQSGAVLFADISGFTALNEACVTHLDRAVVRKNSPDEWKQSIHH